MTSSTVFRVSGRPGSRPDLLSPPYRIFDDRPFRGDGDLLALAFAPDGSLWAVEEPGVLRHWNTIGGQQIAWHFLSEFEMLWTFGDDARWLASASDDVSLWDTATGSLRAVLPQPCWVTAIAFSKDPCLLATGHEDGVVRVWDITDKRMVCECGGHTGSISAVAFDFEGRRLASAGEKKIIRLFDVPSGVPRGTLTGHTDRIPALAWHPSGQRLYSAGWDTTVRVWSVANCQPIILLNNHATQVTAMTLNRDGTVLASADSARRVQLWDTNHNTMLHVFAEIESDVRSLAFSPDGAHLAAGGMEAVVQVFSRDTATRGWAPSSHPSRFAATRIRADSATRTGSEFPGPDCETSINVALSPDGSRLAHAGASGLRVWDVETAQIVMRPTGGDLISAVAFSPEGRWLAGGGTDGRIRLWDATTGRTAAVLEGQAEPLTTVAFAPNGATLAAGAGTSTDVWLWDLATQEPILLIPDAADRRSVQSVAFDSSCKLLAVGGMDCFTPGRPRPRWQESDSEAVHVWDVETRSLIWTLAGSLRVAFHSSLPLLAATSRTSSIRVWDLATKRLVRELIAGDEGLTSIAFSSDGRWLAAGDKGHVLRLWDADELVLRGLLELDSRINALCFSPDGRYLYTGNGNTSCYQIEVRHLLEWGV